MEGEKKEPEGVKCQCGEHTPFSAWVYAHWREKIDFTCPKCGTKYIVREGRKKLAC